MLGTIRSGNPQCFDSLAISWVAITVWHGNGANLGWPAAFLELDDEVVHDDTHLHSLSLVILTQSRKGDIIFSQATVSGLEESGNVTVIPAGEKSHE